jgi:hypothetical protein
MNDQTIHTLSFVFDNQTDHLLMVQISEDGPLKRKLTGIKSEIELSEGTREAAIRSINAATGLVFSKAVLRGVVKTICAESNAANIYLVYESSMVSGELTGSMGRGLKWVDILNVFNLPLEPLVLKIMPHLLEGESFFEGTIHLNDQDEVERSDVHNCNTF